MFVLIRGDFKGNIFCYGLLYIQGSRVPSFQHWNGDFLLCCPSSQQLSVRGAVWAFWEFSIGRVSSHHNKALWVSVSSGMKCYPWVLPCFPLRVVSPGEYGQNNSVCSAPCLGLANLPQPSHLLEECNSNYDSNDDGERAFFMHKRQIVHVFIADNF